MQNLKSTFHRDVTYLPSSEAPAHKLVISYGQAVNGKNIGLLVDTRGLSPEDTDMLSKFRAVGKALAKFSGNPNDIETWELETMLPYDA